MARNDETMLNILFTKVDGNPVIDEETSEYYIPFWKESDYFETYETYINFIKQVESMVRKHSFYKKYIAYLTEVIGLKTCQILSNVEAEKGVTIEMHHGPILTLFDTVQIVLNSLLARECKNITTFKVADIVLQEHQLNNVRVVLVSKTAHQQIHADNIILNYHQGFGDTNAFIAKYRDGLDSIMINNINNYIEWSKNNDSFDNNVFQISESIKSWGHNQFILED